MSTLVWHACLRLRNYLPADIAGDRADVISAIEKIFAARGQHAEVDGFTDQVDVSMNGRKIAVYMAGG